MQSSLWIFFLGGHVWRPILDRKEEQIFNICINSKNKPILLIDFTTARNNMVKFTLIR